MKKKSDSLKCSAESEDSGLGLKILAWERKSKRSLRKLVPSVHPSTYRQSFVVSGQTTMTNTPAKSTEKDSGTRNSSNPTSGTSEQTKYLNMTYLQQDFPVSLFPLRENARVFKTKQGELFSTKYAELLEVKDQSSYSLRMLKDYFLTTQAEPSQSYSFHWMNLGIMLNGKCLTLNIGYPRTAKGSLSSVLEKKVDEKYYLSEKSLKSFIRNKLDVVGERASSIKATYHKGGISKRGTNLLYEGAILSDKNKKWIKNGKQLSRNFPQGQRVYSSKGIASNICGDAGGLGGKTGLYVVADRTRTLAGKGRNLESPKSITNALSGVQKDNLLLSKAKIRRLTPKECERLQGFPDDWTEGVSDTQRYKAMGNAVSVPVIKAIGRAILRVNN